MLLNENVGRYVEGKESGFIFKISSVFFRSWADGVENTKSYYNLTPLFNIDIDYVEIDEDSFNEKFVFITDEEYREKREKFKKKPLSYKDLNI